MIINSVFEILILQPASLRGDNGTKFYIYSDYTPDFLTEASKSSSLSPHKSAEDDSVIFILENRFLARNKSQYYLTNEKRDLNFENFVISTGVCNATAQKSNFPIPHVRSSSSHRNLSQNRKEDEL